MRLSIFITFTALLAACSKPQENVSFVPSDEDRRLLIHLKTVEWPKAYREHDTLLLDRILADEFQMIDQNGNRFTKQDELVWIKENASDPDSFRYEIKRLDIFENGSAIVSGTGHILDDSAYTTYQSSNVLIKRNGQWKAVASHVSGIKEHSPQ